MSVALNNKRTFIPNKSGTLTDLIQSKEYIQLAKINNLKVGFQRTMQISVLTMQFYCTTKLIVKLVHFINYFFESIPNLDRTYNFNIIAK